MNHATLVAHQTLLRDVDALIRAGRLPAAVARLKNLNLSRVPRPLRRDFARACRRTGLIAAGLRLLQPLVRHERARVEPASAAERAEYAVLLSRLGATDEALRWLAGVDPAVAPEAWLYRGFCHVGQWDYAAAREDFSHYLDVETDPYARLVARVNLGACLVNTEDPRALPWLDETIALARTADAGRLVANGLELRGRWLLAVDRPDESRADLAAAATLLDRSQSADQLLIRQWQAALDARRDDSIAPLVEFRTEARRRGQWESCREADFLMLRQAFDENLFHHLIYGTPHEAYRRRVIASLGRAPAPIYRRGHAAGVALDLSATSAGADKIDDLLRALARDFYAPRGVGAVFADLYPGEYFDIASSPLRIRQLVARARRWLKARGLNVDIVHADRGYRLDLGADAAMIFALTPRPAEWALLRAAVGEGWFGARAGAAALGVSASSFRRLVDAAVARGWLERRGAGPSTRYRVRFAGAA